MSRFAAPYRVVLAGLFLGLAGNMALLRAGEDPRTALAFVEELRQRGLHWSVRMTSTSGFAAIIGVARPIHSKRKASDFMRRGVADRHE